MGCIEHTTLDEWRATIGVNLEGTFLGCRAAVRAMKDAGGVIINMSSVSGLVGDADYAAYDASKGGVRLLSKSVAVYCARERYNIRCNSVHPGSIDTPMTLHLRSTAAAVGAGAQARRTWTLRTTRRSRLVDPLSGLGRGVLHQRRGVHH